jgi:hypothetical protein
MSYDNGLTVEKVPNSGGYTLGVYDPLHNCLIMLVTGAAVPDSIVRLLPIEAGFPGQSLAHNIYTATDTYEAKWPGWRKVTAIGGGGSGGGVQATATTSRALSGGGGGGAEAVFWVWMDTGDILYLTVGTGGNQPTAGNNPGNAGGDTKVGSSLAGAEYVTAGGGAAGTAANAGNNAIVRGAVSAGGAITWGALMGSAGDKARGFTGNPSQRAFSYTEPATGNTGTVLSQGGRSPVGPTPSAVSDLGTINTDGQVGVGYGAGGEGACAINSTTARKGGAGVDGVVIVEAAA